MAGKYPKDHASVTFTPAFTGTGDLDHEGKTRCAWLTDTYGLVIHTSVISNIAPPWTVSHVRSGYVVAYAPTWQAALKLARLLGECGSWNRDMSEIEADKAFRMAAGDIVRGHGAERYRRSNPLA